MKNILLLSLLIISSIVYSQSQPNGLSVLESSFNNDTDFYSVLINSNAIVLLEDGVSTVIEFNTSTDIKSNNEKTTYYFVDSVLTSYTISFKQEKTPSIQYFSDLYGLSDFDELSNIYTWKSNLNKLYARFIGNKNELTIEIK